jgi:TRAP-type C4-dicarboxylate transport system permease small subunit
MRFLVVFFMLIVVFVSFGLLVAGSETGWSYENANWILIFLIAVGAAALCALLDHVGMKKNR